MTDKVMIDGVDVNGCEFAESSIVDNQIRIICKYCKYRGEFIYGCENNPNCYYKQLARKTEECERYKQALEQIKYITTELYLGVKDSDRPYCEKILQKCEVLNDNQE